MLQGQTSISDHAGHVIGVDIGGTRTRLAYLSGNDLRVLAQGPTPQEPMLAVDFVCDSVLRAGPAGSIHGVSIACPGPLSQTLGRVQSPANLPGWTDFPIRDLVEARLNAPVLIDNDANLGALGEARYGSGRGYASVYYMMISTGIGTGIVVDGKIRQGANGLAGEVWAFHPGLFGGDANGENVNDLSSGNGMVQRTSRMIAQGARTSIPPGACTMPVIMAAFEGGDPLARQVVRTARETLAATLCFVISVMDPNIVVLGGGLCRNENWFVYPVRELVQRGIALRELAATPIRRASLWDEAVLYGASSLFDFSRGDSH